MSDSKVVNFAKHQQQKQAVIRREYERILYKQFLGGYTVIENLGLKGVELHDISKSGCLFSMDPHDGAFNVGEDIDFRFYFSTNAYVPAKLKIVRAEKLDEGYGVRWQYGCSFDLANQSYPALEKFVDFLDAFAQAAREDKGDQKNLPW
ncbi:MAG TPA: PilZ domain-containing protein [Bdellovibrionota bacterium]|nr:PilZ domain-containing protein [Bdellovibrionota bacterium]